MEDRLRTLESVALLELEAKRQQRRVVEGLLNRLDAERANASEALYVRVRADYESRIKLLDGEIAGPADLVRKDLERLRAIHAEVRTLLEGLRLDQEELDLRRRLGEFAPEEVEPRLAELRQREKSAAQEAQAIVSLETRIMSALFASEDEETAVAPTPSSATAAPAPGTDSALETQAAPEIEREPEAKPRLETQLDPQANETKPESQTGLASEAFSLVKAPVSADALVQAEAPPIFAPPPPAIDPELPTFRFPATESATEADSLSAAEVQISNSLPPPLPILPQLEPAESLREPSSPIAIELLPPALIPVDPGSTLAIDPSGPTTMLPVLNDQGPSTAQMGRTTLLELAFLLPVEPIQGVPEEFPLDAVTSVGRTNHNQLQLPVPEISRQHAQVVLTTEGWTVRDLGAENGTFVNNQRVKEQVLLNGDVVRFSTIGFTFKSASRG